MLKFFFFESLNDIVMPKRLNDRQNKNDINNVNDDASNVKVPISKFLCLNLFFTIANATDDNV